MIICPECKKEHNGSGIPPSLAGRIKTCVKCYKKSKKNYDRLWRYNNPSKVRAYSKKRYKKLTLKQLAIKWRIRTLYSKIKNAEFKQKRKYSKDRADRIIKYKDDLELEQQEFKRLNLPKTIVVKSIATGK